MGNYFSTEYNTNEQFNDIKNDIKEFLDISSDVASEVVLELSNIFNHTEPFSYFNEQTIKNIVLKNKLVQNFSKDIISGKDTKKIYHKYTINTIEIEHYPLTNYLKVMKYGNTEFSFIFPELVRKIYI